MGSQAALSGMENREDLLLPTLASYLRQPERRCVDHRQIGDIIEMPFLPGD